MLTPPRAMHRFATQSEFAFSNLGMSTYTSQAKKKCLTVNQVELSHILTFTRAAVFSENDTLVAVE